MGMLAEAAVTDPCEAFFHLMRLLYYGQLKKEHKTLLGLRL